MDGTEGGGLQRVVVVAVDKQTMGRRLGSNGAAAPAGSGGTEVDWEDQRVEVDRKVLTVVLDDVQTGGGRVVELGALAGLGVGSDVTPMILGAQKPVK